MEALKSLKAVYMNGCVSGQLQLDCQPTAVGQASDQERFVQAVRARSCAGAFAGILEQAHPIDPGG